MAMRLSSRYAFLSYASNLAAMRVLTPEKCDTEILYRSDWDSYDFWCKIAECGHKSSGNTRAGWPHWLGFQDVSLRHETKCWRMLRFPEFWIPGQMAKHLWSCAHVQPAAIQPWLSHLFSCCCWDDNVRRVLHFILFRVILVLSEDGFVAKMPRWHFESNAEKTSAVVSL